MATSIVAGASSPLGLAGVCPNCGRELRNPAGVNLSLSLRWELKCACGAVVSIENGRFVTNPPAGGRPKKRCHQEGQKAPRSALDGPSQALLFAPLDYTTSGQGKKRPQGRKEAPRSFG